MQVTPETVPMPVTIPPDGTDSPGYRSWAAKGESSRKEVPGSIKAVTRLFFDVIVRTKSIKDTAHTLSATSSLASYAFP